MLSLPITDPVPQLAARVGRVTPGEGIAELVRSQWDRVRVEDADCTPTHEPDGRLAVVHACVHLGALLPVDVVVELVRVHEATPATPAGRVLALLWSGHSYGNGSYAYEATVPEEVILEPGRLMIRVAPVGGHGLGAVLAPVTRPIGQVVACDRSPAASG